MGLQTLVTSHKIPGMVAISSGQIIRIIGKSIRKRHRRVSTITANHLDVSIFSFPEKSKALLPIMADSQEPVPLISFNFYTPLSQNVYFLPTLISVFRNDYP